jgi:hypothetical protein
LATVTVVAAPTVIAVGAVPPVVKLAIAVTAPSLS